MKLDSSIGRALRNTTTARPVVIHCCLHCGKGLAVRAGP
jgi:hypothetical protein